LPSPRQNQQQLVISPTSQFPKLQFLEIKPRTRRLFSDSFQEAKKEMVAPAGKAVELQGEAEEEARSRGGASE